MSKQFIMSGIDPVINLVGFQSPIGRWARQWMRFSNWVWGGMLRGGLIVMKADSLPSRLRII